MAATAGAPPKPRAQSVWNFEVELQLVILVELLRQGFAVLVYWLARPVASAPAVAYLCAMLTTVLLPLPRSACTLRGCNSLLLQSSARVACSLWLYVWLGLFNLHDTFA